MTTFYFVKPRSLPLSLRVDDIVVTNKNSMAEAFNHHFINSGFVSESLNSIATAPATLVPAAFQHLLTVFPSGLF